MPKLRWGGERVGLLSGRLRTGYISKELIEFLLEHAEPELVGRDGLHYYHVPELLDMDLPDRFKAELGILLQADRELLYIALQP